MIWEDIDDHHKRAKVFGGWLVKAYEDVVTTDDRLRPLEKGYEWRISMCFVPDTNYEWNL